MPTASTRSTEATSEAGLVMQFACPLFRDPGRSRADADECHFVLLDTINRDAAVDGSGADRGSGGVRDVGVGTVAVRRHGNRTAAAAMYGDDMGEVSRDASHHWEHVVAGPTRVLVEGPRVACHPHDAHDVADLVRRDRVDEGRLVALDRGDAAHDRGAVVAQLRD